MLFFIAMVCLPLPLIAELMKIPGFFSPMELAIPARDFLEMDLQEVRVILKPQKETHYLASLQWILYGGPYLTIVLWGSLLACRLFLRRSKKASDASTDTVNIPDRKEDVPERARLGRRLHLLARSSSNGLWLPLMLVISAYLWATPGIIIEQERQYQTSVAPVRNVVGHRQLVAQIEDEVKREDDLMEEFQANAAADIDQLLIQLRSRR